MAQLPLDTREYLLTQLQNCLATIQPGVKFTLSGGQFPPNQKHRPITTAVKGVFSKMRTEVKVDDADRPYLEIITSPSTPDRITPKDDNFYEREVFVEIWGYAASNDSGDDPNSLVRPLLNAMLADLQIAVEAFPWWTDGGAREPATKVLGAVIITPLRQFTEPTIETAAGSLVLEYSFRYLFHRLFP